MNTDAKHPVIIYAESTPNPASMKFVANQLLLSDGATAQYLSKAETKGAPLAAKLFEFPFVKAVFFASNFVTVLKTDAVQWDEITLELRDFIRTYINEGKPIITELPKTEVAVDNTFTTKKPVFTEHSAPSTETEVKIVEILEQYIRPAVEGDGGSITFKSFNDGVVTVQLRGSCSGCPSSTITLKAGIEGLLKRMVPEVTEVVSEAL
ncbi:MAG TPA: NifU family protein [Bacteroidia bacterium]|jgi:Fe-S cluster biogenesis protein NfuA|nr:NifU family protein [Bacteroidia bacterium]